jgi:hypothetical protein
LVNTVTLYRSPVRLVKHASEDINIYSSQAISRARKRLMAEIMLMGDEILIDDVAYSRNDASTLLDVITEESWKVHNIIYTHKGLLDFLEKESFNEEELKKADAYLYNSSFVQAVSPYFAHSFNTVSGRMLRQKEFAELAKLLNYQGYISPEHSHEGYHKIRTYLDELNYTLRNLSWEKFVAEESILHFIFSDDWKRFLNKLPSAFTTLRDEVVEQMTGIVLRFQHKATWYYLHQVLVQLKAIETNDFNRSEVERIDKVIYENSKLEGKKGTSKSNDGEISTGRIIWWAIWIVLLIVRIATCNDTSNKTNFEFDKNTFKQYQKTQVSRIDEKRNEPLLLNFLDSLSQVKSLALTKQEQPMKTGSQPFSSFADNFPEWGSETVVINNSTGHHCVVLYIDGASKQGSVYEGALSHVAAVYIQKGESYSIPFTPGNGKFYFVFGDKWGMLKKQAELSIYSERGYTNSNGRKHLLFVYEFFSNQKPLQQPYLLQGISIDDTSTDRDETDYSYLNKPEKGTTEEKTTLTLKEKKNQFAIEATGKLPVKTDKKVMADTFSNELPMVEVKVGEDQ